ncbi:MAG: AarF/UbiB family protein [Sandaracinaceae bacterium]|nr:AarF/UbiB family protein [Sandaracinaceae bacterium]
MEIIAELKKLQDRVPPVSYAEVRAQIQAELGAPVEEVFASFDEAPSRRRRSDRCTAPRCRRARGSGPSRSRSSARNIKDVIERDIDLLYWLAKAIERSIPESRIYQPVKLVSEFDRAISAELDFGLEADNAIKFAKNFEGNARIHFPFVYRRASASAS